MLTNEKCNLNKLNDLISEELTPFVRKVDEEAYFAESYLKRLGEEGFFANDGLEREVLLQRITLVEETAKVCMTTAFCVWCHLAAITYLTFTKNTPLQERILPQLLSGKSLAGTGLSNPLKSFAKLETIHLKAKRVPNGFIVNGVLPAVSNLGEGHVFAFVAQSESNREIMGLLSCDVSGLVLKKRTDFVGVNGSATFSCQFNNVFIPEEDIISLEAKRFIELVRKRFVSYQIPLGIGVTASCIEKMEQMNEKNPTINKHLCVHPKQLKLRNDDLRNRLIEVIQSTEYSWEELLAIRLEIVYLTLETVQASMIYSGGKGYMKKSAAARKLREAYFLVNLTPTVKHLELFANS